MPVQLLAVCGSLRAESSNVKLLQAAARLAPAGVEVVFFTELAVLPHFNPDDESVGHPAVKAWQAALTSAAGVLVCSPEYAHGIPGSLKNALDWVVGSGEFVGKPVALLNASPRSVHAAAQLHEVLKTMDARIVSSVAVPVAGRKLDVAGIVADPTLAGPVRDAVSAVVAGRMA
ncbi:NADPH-dependent FMN reductase [Limnoglobus roseus]|uniref:NAD(P)H-dependent oxidoreductase n=1 Tax=Limnoglobus roseus TaxID=2598579 RepID=A0A5C1A437_9BACT|nr:NAD(P)H-dependent oxidoreductase [Limnoglobus roseus]QEL13380.1 NAD(P)H-dependent oxidoreductase [Limnoglobus roseus]